MNIAEISIKRPVFIIMIIFSIITLGIIGYNNLPVDLLPSVDYPNLNVNVVYEGASANEIELLITKPLENALGTVEGLEQITSFTREGQARISVTFKLGTDIKFAELKVREKVDATLPKLPEGIKAPTIRRFSTDDIPIAVLSVKGNKTRADLTEMIENVIQPKIEATEGVGGINIFGGLDKIIKVDINRSLLQANGLTYNQIVSAIALRNVSKPIGIIEGREKNVTLRVIGKIKNVDEIGDIVITTQNDKILKIKDIAAISFTVADETMVARVDGENAVLFSIYKQSGENTIKVARNVKETIKLLDNEIPKGCIVKIVNDSSLNIERSIKGVEEDILFGAFLAILIVWLFLGNFRSTVITAIALPNSLIGAFFLINLSGFTINTMTLLALSLSVGLLIDDSIVVRENIFRYIENGMPPKKAAILGTNEVGLAVLSTTLAILAVFIPISFLKGVTGQFFKEFGLTVAFALMISLADAFTSAPMFSAYWFKQHTKEGKEGFTRYFSMISEYWNKGYTITNNYYKKLLEWCLERKLVVIIPVTVLFFLVIFLTRFLGQNFMNPTDSGMYSINLETYPGAPISKIDIYVKEIEKYLNTKKDIETYYAQVGDNNQSHTAQINVTMKGLKERKISTSAMVADTRNYIKTNFDLYLKSRVNERTAFMGGFGGGGSPININVYGSDFSELEALSGQILNIVSSTPGITDLTSTVKSGTPELIIKIDNIKAEKVGISVEELGNTLKDLIQGDVVSSYALNNNDYDIVLRLNEKDRKSLSDIKNIIIRTKSGKKILLSSICTFNYSSAPLEIRRENSQRIVKISGNIAKNFSLTKVITNAKELLNRELVMPMGYRYEFVGTQKDFQDLISQIQIALLLAMLFMYMILASLYNSFIQPLYIMLSIPLAIIGSILGLLFTGVDLDLYGYIGILLVCGLVAKNAILLIDYTNKKREEGLTLKKALLTAGSIRLRPILMTTFAMIFGMLPLALGLNEGSSGRQALPVTVIGGLLTSTFLTLILVPVVYEWAEGLKAGLRKKIIKNKKN